MAEQIIFTDLDGTLLDHYNYSFQDARIALGYIKRKVIPLVIVTSKTFSEVRVVQEKLDITCPFIVENGAGIFISPKSVLAKDLIHEQRYTKISKAQSYLEIRLFFNKLKENYKIRGYGDMSVEQVMSLTGLSKESALQSMQRDFTEPFIVEDEKVDIEAIRKEANAEGLDIVKGGRFYHLITMGQDKAEAMKYLKHLFEESFGKELQMIALGDSANDFTMLKAADIGVLIPSPNGSYADIRDDSILKAKYPGPKGWSEALMEILDDG